ncbi:MAG: 5'/3'-nucleotidase SurE, partial [Thermoleophilaceae bacterium]
LLMVSAGVFLAAMTEMVIAYGAGGPGDLTEARRPRIGRVRVLITNDDGIAATGLQQLRKALTAVPGIEVSVVAPDSNRSATARSITTRSPLWVEEIEFDDGTAGFACDGTPVDCVRFAELGLIGERPELIVSGINHGANLGDDITYSGTVAAALEGIVLGIPAIAISQQSGKREMDFHYGRDFDFSIAAAFAARLVQRVDEDPLPADTLLNVNCPAGEPTGIEVTHLGKRLYNDEMKLVDEDSEGRRRYQIYGFEPSFEDEEGSDLSAIARGRIAVTPVHFDLTDHSGLDRLRGWDLDAMLAASTG